MEPQSGQRVAEEAKPAQISISATVSMIAKLDLAAIFDNSEKMVMGLILKTVRKGYLDL